VPEESQATAERWQSARLTWMIALCALCPLVLGSVLNLWVNPFRLYGAEVFDPATSNGRLQKFTLLRQMSPPPSSLILGSSRVMTMDPAYVEACLPGGCFNFGVASAVAEDYYASLRLAVEDAAAPITHVILGIDHSALHPSVPVMYEARYFPRYAGYVNGADGGSPLWQDRLAMLISAEQLEESLNVLRRTAKRTLKSPKIELQPDGHAVQVAREKAIAAGEFSLERTLSQRVLHHPSYSLRLSSFTDPSRRRLEYIARLLDYCSERGIQVHAYITPLHPRQWEVLDSLPQSQVLAATTVALEHVFTAHGLVLHDFSRIESFGGSAEFFYDEQHLMPENQRRIAAALLGGES
jgi:hypothetical protein